MSSDDDWFGPTWNTSWDVFDDNWLTEDDTTDDVSNCAVGGLPHLLKIELFNTCLIRCDGSALNANFASFYSLGAVNCDLVVGGVTVFDAQIEVLNVQV